MSSKFSSFADDSLSFTMRYNIFYTVKEHTFKNDQSFVV